MIPMASKECAVRQKVADFCAAEATRLKVWEFLVVMQLGNNPERAITVQLNVCSSCNPNDLSMDHQIVVDHLDKPEVQRTDPCCSEAEAPAGALFTKLKESGTRNPTARQSLEVGHDVLFHTQTCPYLVQTCLQFA